MTARGLQRLMSTFSVGTRINHTSTGEKGTSFYVRFWTGSRWVSILFHGALCSREQKCWSNLIFLRCSRGRIRLNRWHAFNIPLRASLDSSRGAPHDWTPVELRGDAAVRVVLLSFSEKRLASSELNLYSGIRRLFKVNILSLWSTGKPQKRLVGKI